MKLSLINVFFLLNNNLLWKYYPIKNNKHNTKNKMLPCFRHMPNIIINYPKYKKIEMQKIK